MVENYKTIVVFAQAAILVLALGRIITPFALLPGMVAMLFLRKRSNGEANEREVLVLIKDILRNYKAGLRRAVGSATARDANCPKELPALISDFRLGSYGDQHDFPQIRNRHMLELVRIISHGLSTGSNVSNSLELLGKRVEQEITTRNRIRSRIGSMQSVTFLGMAFFLPLFGGISSMILGTSISIIQGNVAALQQAFLCSIAAYILAILFIEAFFRNPEAGLSENVWRILPIFSISSVILLASATYINYAI